MVQTDRRVLQFGCAMALVLLLVFVPFLGIIILFAVTGGLTLVYAAMAGGLYKEPLLAEFRRYGDQPQTYPLVNLLVFGSLTSFVLLMVVPLILVQGSFFARLVPSMVFVIMGLLLCGAALIVYRHPALRTSLPLWYAHLLRNASRQERRHIGWAWLRLPRLMRLRLNGDNKAFEVWADMVRLTVIYGAYDPDSPWHRWT